MPGLQATTEVKIKKSPTGRTDWPYKYEARVGISMFGYSNPGSDNPFDEDFNDNYVSGKGMTKAAAIKMLEKKWKELHESLWV